MNVTAAIKAIPANTRGCGMDEKDVSDRAVRIFFLEDFLRLDIYLLSSGITPSQLSGGRRLCSAM